MRSGRTHFGPRLGFALALAFMLASGKAAYAAGSSHPVKVWVSRIGDPAIYFRASYPEAVSAPAPGDTMLVYDPSRKFQEFEGYGAALTDSSLIVLGQLPPGKREALLRALFHPLHGLNINYLRVPIGASDFGSSAYTYLDLPPGQEDPALDKFDFRRALPAVSMLQKLKTINPRLRVMLSPWSPPAWMKTSGQLAGGRLKREHYGTFARYLVQVLRSYSARGVEVDAITIQNEPFFQNDKYPSMEMSTAEQVEFLRDYFLPLLRRQGFRTRVLGLDHNYDLRSEAEAIYSSLGDQLAGIAYHCYGGSFDGLAGSTVPFYQTECSGGGWSDDAETFHFWLQSQLIGAGLLGNRLSLAWNLVLDQNHGPFIGYCDNCRGLVDVDTKTQKVTYNPELIALAHGGKFLAPGARRIASDPPADGGYSTIAYRNRDGSVIQVTENSSPQDRTFVISSGAEGYYRFSIPAGGVATVRLPVRGP